MSTLKNNEQNENETRKFKIYAHVNKVNGKVYIGQTCKSPKQRWDNGKGYSYNGHFWNAIQKYGWDNFEHIILFEVDTQELANISEEFLIKKYKTNNSNYGYNILSGGSNVCGENNPNYGNKYSEETKKKMSDISKKRLSNKENHPMYGKHLSDETREKIRIGNKKRKITQMQIKKKCELDPTVHSIYKLDEKMNILHTYTTKKELSDELGKNANMFFPKKPYCVYDNFIYIFTDFYDSKKGDRDFLDYVDRKFHNSNTGSKKVICLKIL